MELKRNAVLRRLCICFCLVLLAALLYRWQRIFWLMCADYIISDMPNHVKLALGDADYGLASFIVGFLYTNFAENFAHTALSMLLAANQLLGIFTLWLLVCRMLPALDKCAGLLAVILAHLCGPWIIPGVESQMGMYLGVYNGNVYHNMTVLFSRSFIPLVFLFFFGLWDKRHERIGPEKENLLSWTGMTLSFLICTLFKPNFAFAFIPMLGGWLIYDFIRSRGKNFRNEFILGLTVVPAGLACIWQYLVLFDDNFAGTSSTMALRLVLGAELLGLVVMYLRGLLLPIYSMALQGRKEEGQREHFKLFVICNLIAVLEAIVLTETGFRANDGNFEWGALSMYTTVFALAIALLFKMIKGADMKKSPDRIKVLVGVLLLLGHLIVGVYCLQQPGNTGYDWFYF